MAQHNKKNLKRKTRDFKPEAAPSMLPFQEEAADFPRGGGSVLSRAEVEEARAEIDAEFAAEQNRSKKRKNLRHSNAFEDPSDPLLEPIFGGKLPKFVNTLRYRNLSIGMKLLGVITEVNAKDLIVSLPGGLRGIVTEEEASDLSESHGFIDTTAQGYVRKKTLRGKEFRNESGRVALKDLFTIGQLVPCVVCKLEHVKDSTSVRDRKIIWLSLRLSFLYKGFTIDAVQDEMVMMACVKSIEDHGYILSLGLSSVSGFLPLNKGNNESKLKKGQLVQGVISNIDRTRSVISMKIDPPLVSNSMIKDHKGLSVDLLVPGTMVNAHVQAILHNGLLLSFLTYFTGMVDIFHLQEQFPSSNWHEKYSENQRLKARILYVDPTTKAVGLTLNPYLIQNKSPPLGVKIGEIIEGARVVRIDNGIGVLLELPTESIRTPGYVNISEVSDDNIHKLNKKFKEGMKLRTRVLGFRCTEGIAVTTLKESVLNQAVFSHSDVKPGLVVKGKVVKMEESGAFVQLSNGLKAFCPIQHMSEFNFAKPSKKLKVGVTLPFRILKCKSKRITVTFKKTMVMSKLQVVANYEDAVEGLITHGWITGIGQHGCFVKFYNNVSGFVNRTKLGIDPGTEAESVFHVGQVVRCKVTRVFPALRRLELSFIISSERPQDDVDFTMDVKIGSIVSGVVKNVTSSAIIVDIQFDKGVMKGTIFNEHLSDNPGHSDQIKSLMKSEIKFERLLVLDIKNQNLILSAKYSLIESAGILPSDVLQIHPQSVLHGYISSMIENGVFVRFLGDLTGFASKKHVLDRFNEDLKHFYVGQSIRSQILHVNEETGRIYLSLKQSYCFSTDTSLIKSYFLEQDMISKLQASESGTADINWAQHYMVGSCVEGEVHEIKEYGVIVNLRQNNDIVGFISHYQLGGVSLEIGKKIIARILDIVKSEGIIDLSLRPEVLQNVQLQETKGNSLPKKRKSEQNAELKMHEKVDAVVQLVKDNYLVLSLPKHGNHIGFALTCDYNMWMDSHKHYTTGQKVHATVGALPNASTSGRLLLLLSYLSDSRMSKKVKKELQRKVDSPSELNGISDSQQVCKAGNVKVRCLNETSTVPDMHQVGNEKDLNVDVGSFVEAEVFEIKPLEMLLKFGNGQCGRIDITEVNYEYKEGSAFKGFKIGQKLKASVIEGPRQPNKKGKYVWDLSLRQLIPAGNGVVAKLVCAPASPKFAVGDTVTAVVSKIQKDWVHLVVSSCIKGRMFILDTSSEPSELASFKKRFKVGMCIVCHISNVDMGNRILGLTLRNLSLIHKEHDDDAKAHTKSDFSSDSKNDKLGEIYEGAILGGRINKFFPGTGGMDVQIGAHIYGRVHFTELIDIFNENPLAGYKEGQFVKCKVLKVNANPKLQIDLSLRQSRTDHGAVEVRANNKSQMYSLGCPIDKVDDLRPSMEVQGYVKSISRKGCFVMLSRHIDARIHLSDLSDRYVEDVDEKFPPGKLVKGRIISVDPSSGQISMTLKSKLPIEAFMKGDLVMDNFHVGHIVSGVIKDVDSFRILVTVENSNMVGICYATELSGDYIDNLKMKYSVGKKVEAKVLEIDEGNKCMRLGLKDSYFRNKSESREFVEEDDRDGSDCNEHSKIEVNEECNIKNSSQEIGTISVSNNLPIAREFEARSSVPPLEVTFETQINELEIANDDNKQNHANEPYEIEEKDGTQLTKRAKKRLKEKRELEIRAAEQKRLEGDNAPESVDEYEQLVRASPNSSYVWIKYMAFMLSLADVEKARAIAERALQTINFREEGEKLNIWKAYFNLENVYGNPPNEAVLKVFQRALQYCDPKKVHLALLGMYEQTEQHEMSHQLLKVMTRKFKTSSKVWLRNIQNLLKRGGDAVHMALDHALTSLPRHKHIKLISHAAILEFKIGSAERGRSLFEGILRNYPKRTDLWSVYLDQEIRTRDPTVIRTLFERVICLDLPPKKMKFLFKKYLDYEKSHGDESRVEYVKSKAMEFVDNKLG